MKEVNYDDKLQGLIIMKWLIIIWKRSIIRFLYCFVKIFEHRKFYSGMKTDHKINLNSLFVLFFFYFDAGFLFFDYHRFQIDSQRLSPSKSLPFHLLVWRFFLQAQGCSLKFIFNGLNKYRQLTKTAFFSHVNHPIFIFHYFFKSFQQITS